MLEDTRRDRKAAKPLTRNQMLVFNALQDAGSAMSAYAILDVLRSEGLPAPLQVYRALEKLCANGLVHRIESQNAFILCAHPDGETHPQPVFLICTECKEVRECVDPVITQAILALSEREGFNAMRTILEVEGVCKSCRGKRAEKLSVV